MFEMHTSRREIFQGAYKESLDLKEDQVNPLATGKLRLDFARAL